MKKSFIILFFSAAAVSVMAQEVQDIEVQYNPNSLDPIALYEQHYKVRVWRNIDLREKQNKGFFARNGELTKLIVEALKSGELTDIYAYDSLTTKISKDDFMSRLVAQAPQSFPAWDPAADFYSGD